MHWSLTVTFLCIITLCLQTFASCYPTIFRSCIIFCSFIPPLFFNCKSGLLWQGCDSFSTFGHIFRNINWHTFKATYSIYMHIPIDLKFLVVWAIDEGATIAWNVRCTAGRTATYGLWGCTFQKHLQPEDITYVDITYRVLHNSLHISFQEITVWLCYLQLGVTSWLMHQVLISILSSHFNMTWIG